jgi:hypothetical protein
MHDHTLTHHWRVPDRLHDLPGLAILGKHDRRRARASVLACAVIAYGTDHPAVSYSRRQAWYVGRYDGVPLTYRTVTGAVDEAAAAGYLDGVRAKKGDHLITQRQSTFWATPMLMDALGGIRLEYEPGSAIRLRDAEGNPMAFRETERIARMRREMAYINEAMGQVQVGIDPGAAPEDWEVGLHRIRARKVKDGRETWATVCPTPCNDVYRSFGRGRFDKGGRLYGWWQSLPKDRRRELLINGEFTCEPDYEFLHPTLLYAMRGAVLVGDPYETGYFPRAHGKLALNTSLNAMTLALAVNAIMYKNVIRPGAWPHSRRYTERLVEAVVARNAPIAADIGADRGINCMAIDSGMAVKVLKACAKADIPVLPVHDSFRVRARDEAKVTAIMGEVLDATRVAISPRSAMVSVISFPQMKLSSRVVPLAEPEVASPAEPGGLSGTVVVPSLPEAGVAFRPVLKLPAPRPVASPPTVVVPVPEAVVTSPVVPEPAPSPEAVPVPVAPPVPWVAVPAFLRALLPPPEAVPVPSPEPPVPVAPSRPRSSLSALVASLPPADIGSETVSASLLPAAPEPILVQSVLDPAPLAVVFTEAVLPAPVPAQPLTREERRSALAAVAALSRERIDPEARRRSDAHMAALRGNDRLRGRGV